MLTMAPRLVTRILDGGRPNLDAVGITYVAAAIVYTIFVSGELYMLYRHRSAFCIQIRNMRVVVAAVSMLHIYLILVLLVYPWNGLFPCSAEFWIMSVFLPSGMAFFQACNARVLKAYESQSRLRRNFLEGARKKRVAYTPQGLCEAWLDLDATAKVHIGTVVGLIVSFIPAVIVFFGSRRFHESFGFFGTAADAADAIHCRRGVEWIPSILVQLFWTAVVGPWILWKIRKVHDVHSWAWQTRLAIMAGLPGTPLWMAFTFSNIPAMISINKYFAPAGWFIPSLLVCQQVLVIIPLLFVFKSRTRRSSISSSTTSETLASTSALFRNNNNNNINTDTNEKKTTKCSRGALTLNKELKPKASMQALEFSIEHSIEPLISWAASREFTAENTIFLREVRNFKRKWSTLQTAATPAQRRQMFTEASLVFFTLVNPFTAETPINIEYKIFRQLQDIFSEVEFDPYMPSQAQSHHAQSSSQKSHPSHTSRSNPSARVQPGQQHTNAHANACSNATPQSAVARDNVVCPWEDVLDRPTSFESTETFASASSVRSIVPAQFTDEVFDAAFESIKYLVFTNTWPRYVEAELSKSMEVSP